MKTINFQHYGYPFGPVTGYDASKQMCGSVARGKGRAWWCSRPAGHAGRHEAGGLHGRTAPMLAFELIKRLQKEIDDFGDHEVQDCTERTVTDVYIDIDATTEIVLEFEGDKDE